MEMKNIIKLIETVSASELSEFKLEDGDCKLTFKANRDMISSTACVKPVVEVMQSTQAAELSTETYVDEENEKTVKSPLVGTFYASKSADAAPFVAVGDTVKKGQIIGIVEAMKLMNEVESEFDGVVEAVLVDNEQMVEYGQPLVVIK